MGTFKSPWASRRWTILVSIVVSAALAGVAWYLVHGCGREPKGDAETATAPASAISIVEAMNDANVSETSFQIAYFYLREKHLPASIEEVRQSVHVGGWPPAPTANSRGRAFTYHPTGARTYALTFPAPAPAPGDPSGGVTVPMEVPADMPAQLAPDALRIWWDLEYYKRMTEKLREGLQGPAPPAAPAAPAAQPH